jgi:hypothetical protein
LDLETGRRWHETNQGRRTLQPCHRRASSWNRGQSRQGGQDKCGNTRHSNALRSSGTPHFRGRLFLHSDSAVSPDPHIWAGRTPRGCGNGIKADWPKFSFERGVDSALAPRGCGEGGAEGNRGDRPVPVT